MNYNRGNNGTFCAKHDNTVALMMELDRLCKLAETPIETLHERMTLVEYQWYKQVLKERPEWAKATLARFGYDELITLNTRNL